MIPLSRTPVRRSSSDQRAPVVLTFRVWVIGIVLSIIIASVNTFLYFRANSPSIPAVLVLQVSALCFPPSCTSQER